MSDGATKANSVSLFNILEERIDADLLNAIYRAYARAMCEAQSLEGMLSLLLLETSFEQSSQKDIEDFARNFFDVGKRTKQTLGKLIKSLKSEIRPFPKNFRKNLEHALKFRNFLAHEFFLRFRPKFFREKWVREIVLELETIRRSLEEVNNQLQQVNEAHPRPKAGIALKPLQQRASEEISNLVTLIVLDEQLKHDSDTGAKK